MCRGAQGRLELLRGQTEPLREERGAERVRGLRGRGGGHSASVALTAWRGASRRRPARGAPRVRGLRTSAETRARGGRHVRQSTNVRRSTIKPLCLRPRCLGTPLALLSEARLPGRHALAVPAAGARAEAAEALSCVRGRRANRGPQRLSRKPQAPGRCRPCRPRPAAREADVPRYTGKSQVKGNPT